MMTQERFFEYVRKFHAERFDVIETFPHHPPMPRTFYMHQKVGAANGGFLDLLLDYFSPATDVDRELIRSAFLTPFWGGLPGSRPAFRIEGPENDPPELAGRGTGKSTLPLIVADLAGGYIDLEEGEDFPAFKTRLLSNEEGRKRVVRVDNLKTLRLSWAPLEAFVTSPVISGHALFKGEGQRTNTLTVFITVNGGGLSKDMVQRVITVRLARPAYRAGWSEEVTAFVEEHRWELIGEIIGVLAVEPAMVKAATRWSSWEKGVLSQCSKFNECQRLIAERASAIDVDDDDAFEIEQLFRKNLIERRHDPDAENVKIPSSEVGAWYSEYHGEEGRGERGNVVFEDKTAQAAQIQADDNRAVLALAQEREGPGGKAGRFEALACVGDKNTLMIA